MQGFSIVRDGRGTTYVRELPEPRDVHYESQQATHVVVWFNHTTRDWVVSLGLSDGTQVGSSEYCGYREWALDVANDLVVSGGCI